MHPSFYLFQILQSKGIFIFKIVIEAIFDGRSYADTNSRENILNGLSHHMRYAVSENFQTFSRMNIYQFQLAILMKNMTQVNEIIIKSGCHGICEQLLIPRRNNVPNRNSFRENFFRTIRQYYFDFFHIFNTRTTIQKL
ncbi:MAG: hypothetical protein A4E66_01943 [Syntrophus sp. PtaB.Bin001]|nr:MAG: hypothetical protein A4E66_01943 [Syntrophus sp. PtaB.Bin001]